MAHKSRTPRSPTTAAGIDRMLGFKPKKNKDRESIYGGNVMRDIPPVETVGELKALLAKMPDALPLATADAGYKPVWFNAGFDDEHLSLEPNDGCFD